MFIKSFFKHSPGVFSVLLILMISACQQPGTGNTKTGEDSANPVQQSEDSYAVEKWEGGKLYEKIGLHKVPSQSFALYIPTGYREEGQLPLMIFFDPHARGRLPLKKYRSLADKWEIILAGSNNAQNGMQPSETHAIANNLIDELPRRLPVDPGEIYLSGFSGGARVACMEALRSPLIKGVIGCGAGFPGGVPDRGSAFQYIGIAGNEDFNYLEMKSLDASLGHAGFPHSLIVFDGEHEWPPELVFEKALICLLNGTDERNKKPLMEDKIKEFIANTRQTALELEKVKRFSDAVQYIETTIHCLNHQQGVADLNTLLKKIKSEKGYQEELKRVIAVEKAEKVTQVKLADGFKIGNYDWLISKINKMKDFSNSGTDRLERLSQKRLVNFCGLLGYMYSQASLRKGDLQATKQYLDVYKTASQDNPDFYFLSACYYAQKKDTGKVIELLRQSMKKHTIGKSKILAEPLLNPVKLSAIFSDFIKSIPDSASN